MKLVQSLSLLFALAATGTAYAAPDAKPAPKGDTTTITAADGDKFIAFLNQLVDKVVADKDDCPKMATDVNAVIDDNKELLATAKAAKAQGKQLPKETRDKIGPTLQRLGAGMGKCGADPKVKAAFQRLDMK